MEGPEKLEVEDCNCSICSKSGFLHYIAPRDKFVLLCGQDSLNTYQYVTEVAKHTFCKTCGVKPFYVPRSNTDGIDANVSCLDSDNLTLNNVQFDGQNWEKHAYKLAHKTQ